MALGLGHDFISKRLLIAGVVASVVPDLDVLAFRLGIPYASEFGHRGFSHSLMFALVIAVVGARLARSLRSAPKRSFWFLFLAVASHGMLDAFTNGGLGIAFLWPFSDGRFFAPIRPIEVSPIGLSRFLSLRGMSVLWSEVQWVWLPSLSAAVVAVAFRHYRALTLRSTGLPQKARQTGYLERWASKSAERPRKP